MVTSIGEELSGSRVRQTAAGLVALAAISWDAWLVYGGEADYSGKRILPPVLAATAYLLLTRGRVRSLGLRLAPEQSLRYWLAATLIIGVVIVVSIASVTGVRTLLGYPLARVPYLPENIGPLFVHLCILAPLFEEATYRLAFGPGCVAALGPKTTIVLSGVIFGFLHVLYGNPGPDNLVAGYFLAWAYLKSGSIAVPLALHSLGNLCVLTAWVLARSWFEGAPSYYVY
jgi:membrane protease YdiL (CAAX protease family)